MAATTDMSCGLAAHDTWRILELHGPARQFKIWRAAGCICEEGLKSTFLAAVDAKAGVFAYLGVTFQ
jgi:hypothetical protein